MNVTIALMYGLGFGFTLATIIAAEPHDFTFARGDRFEAVVAWIAALVFAMLWPVVLAYVAIRSAFLAWRDS